MGPVLRRTFCFVSLPIAWVGLFMWVFDPRMDAPEAIVVSIAIVSVASAVVGYAQGRRVSLAVAYAGFTAAISVVGFFVVVFTVVSVGCWGFGNCPS